MRILEILPCFALLLYAFCKLVKSQLFHYLRCIGFTGNIITAGDFAGYLHLWEIHLNPITNQVRIKKYRQIESHENHVVCLYISARRIVSGSRDKSILTQDFWAPVIKK